MISEFNTRTLARRRPVRWTRVAIAVTVAAALAVTAACSSSSKAATNPPTTSLAAGSSSAPTASATAAGSSAAGSPLAAAQAAVTTAEALPTKISVTTPLTSKPPTGKTVVFIQCEEAQCGLEGQGISAAAQALGWTYKQLNFNDTQPATLVTAMNQALQYHPVAVMFAGQPESEWASVIPAYKKAGALIVPDAPGNDTVTDATIPAITQGNDFQTIQGKLLADYVAVDSGGSANILFETVPTYSTFLPTSAAFKSELATVCPNCKVSTLSNTIPDLFAGKIDASVVSKLKTSPDVNYLVSVDGAFITGLTSALKSAGLDGKYKIVTASGGPMNMQDVQNGTEDATFAYGFKYTGWAAVDAALRSMQGLAIPTGDTGGNPQYLITKGSTQTPTASLDLPSDYEAQFKALWLVS